MTKQEPPITENLFIKDGKINGDLVAKFQEAMKIDKDFDAAKSLGIIAPTAIVPDTLKSSDVKTVEEIDKLKKIASFALDTLKNEHGIDLTATPVQSKMSEAEQAISAKVEKMALAKFGEQLSEIQKIDPDFPVTELKSLEVPTEAKIQLAETIRNITQRNVNAVSKVKSELDKITSELTETKAKVPKSDTPDTKDGNTRVHEAAAKFGLDLHEKVPTASENLVEALKAITKAGGT
jgi:aspartate carbamoyltransferase regulatory subunit